jgi:hypothetical protein
MTSRADTLLRELYAHIESGLLVRNIERDQEEGWGMRMLPLVRTLAATDAYLSSPQEPPVGGEDVVAKFREFIEEVHAAEGDYGIGLAITKAESYLERLAATNTQECAHEWGSRWQQSLERGEERWRECKFCGEKRATNTQEQPVAPDHPAEVAALIERLREPRAGIHEDSQEELKSWQTLFNQCLEAAAMLARLSAPQPERELWQARAEQLSSMADGESAESYWGKVDALVERNRTATHEAVK